MARGTAILLVVLLLLAGCAAEPTVRLGEGGGQDPRSLTVGELTLGSYSRTVANYSYFDIQGSQIESREGRYANERWITLDNDSKDRFLRPIRGVKFALRESYGDVNETNPPIARSASVFDLATGEPVRRDGSQKARRSWNLCFLPYMFCETLHQDWTGDYQYYPRQGEKADWGSLAGRTVRLGDRVSFHRDIDAGSTQYRFFLNYTAKRIERVEGERAILMEWSMALVDLDPAPPEPKLRPSPTRTPAPRLPEAVRHQWFTERSPFPAKAVTNVPQFLDGVVLWSNSTARLEEHKPGAQPVRWGSEAPLPRVTVMPGATKAPYASFLQGVQGGRLQYGLLDAWENARGDLTLSRFQDYLSANPSAYPFLALYLPDEGRGTYTWSMMVSNPGERSRWLVESRLQPLAGAPIVQNRAESAGSFYVPPPATLTPTLELVRYEDVVKSMEAYSGRTAPSSVLVALVSNRFNSAQGFEPLVVFLEPEWLRSSGFGSVFDRAWVADGAVAFSLHDGGILGVNNTAISGTSRYPWIPFLEP